MGRSYTIQDPRLDLDEYPEVLYRIHLPNHSATDYDSGSGFECRAAGRIDICNFKQLSNALDSHLNWYSGNPSHFISTFGNYNHAIYWAQKQLSKGKVKTAMIMEIDPYEIKNAFGSHIPILEMSSLINRYPRLLPDRIKEEWVDDEFLVLYKIPDEAIMTVKQVFI